MTFETLDIPIKNLKRNTGQIPGVPKNPRIIKDNNFKKLKDSIVQDPEMLELREIIAYKQGDEYIIIGGNMRFEALKALNFEKAKCKVITGETTPEQLKRIILKDNSAYGEWDFDELANEWEEALLNACAIDIPTMEVPKLEEEAEEDEFDETKETIPARCSKGEIWQLGRHRLMCGDSTDGGAVALLMNGEKADLVFTDPPYGMNLDTDYSSMQGIAGGNKYAAGHVDEFRPEMVQAAINLGAAETFLFGADYFAELLPNKNGGSWIVWDKRANDGGTIEQDASSDKMFGSCFELCWSKAKHKREIARIKWAGLFGLQGEFDHKRCHPTQKPIALVAWFLNRFGKEGDIVADVFGGSGSTLIACEQLNRTCYMMELEPHYCDVIIARWEKLTGRQAVKLGNINEMPKTEGTNNQNRD